MEDARRDMTHCPGTVRKREVRRLFFFFFFKYPARHPGAVLFINRDELQWDTHNDRGIGADERSSPKLFLKYVYERPHP